MQTYCLSRKKHTDNNYSEKVIMANKDIREKSKCVSCGAKKSRFVKQNIIEKLVWTILILNFSYTNPYWIFWNIV